MTKSCYVCKKLWIPGDCRSFHKFPSNSDAKQKWMCAIGVLLVPKTATICSDHFDQNSFHQTDGYTSVRRLLSDAVPSVLLNEKQQNESRILKNIDTEDCRYNESLHDEEISMIKVFQEVEEGSSHTYNKICRSKKCIGQKEFVRKTNKKNKNGTSVVIDNLSMGQSNNLVTENSEMLYTNSDIDQQLVSEQNVSKRVHSDARNILDCTAKGNSCVLSSAFTDGKQNETSTNLDQQRQNKGSGIKVISLSLLQYNNISDLSIKRKRSVHDIQNIAYVKKICFMDGFETKYVTRADFVSDAAWDNFLRYKACRDAQNKAARKNIYKVQTKKITKN